MVDLGKIGVDLSEFKCWAREADTKGGALNWVIRENKQTNKYGESQLLLFWA